MYDGKLQSDDASGLWHIQLVSFVEAEMQRAYACASFCFFELQLETQFK